MEGKKVRVGGVASCLEEGGNDVGVSVEVAGVGIMVNVEISG